MASTGQFADQVLELGARDGLVVGHGFVVVHLVGRGQQRPQGDALLGQVVRGQDEVGLGAQGQGLVLVVDPVLD